MAKETAQQTTEAARPAEKTLEFRVDTEAQHPFFSLAVAVGTSVEDAIGLVADAAIKARTKGGAAFQRMVNEGYQVRTVPTNRIVKPATHLRGTEPRHYLVNPSGDNGYKLL